MMAEADLSALSIPIAMLDGRAHDDMPEGTE